jgi:hypothetical protein
VHPGNLLTGPKEEEEEEAEEEEEEEEESSKLHESSGEVSTKLFFWGPKTSGSEQLQVFRSNLKQRFKLG